MRNFTRLLVLCLVAGLLAAAPVAASSTIQRTGQAVAPSSTTDGTPLSTAKVVLIVGATGSATANYRDVADSAYATAIQYSSNVVKVYSPNATWAAAKAAMTGASVVIYLGHGNGWPSPYTYDPSYTTKDGMGLNATANSGDSNTKYYGEPALATVDLAPNAVVLLNHLCYASGNSEPQNPAPTLSVAQQRADNYGQGFIKAGAGAVIAEGHGSINGMIRDLFTTHQSVVDLWRGQYDYHHNEFSFPSMRNAAYDVYMDPDTSTGGYYRSLVGAPGLRTEDVTGVPFTPTTDTPDQLLAPGAAAVGSAAAELSSTSTLADTTGSLASGTIVRVEDLAAGGDAALVRTLDGATSGWTASAGLLPRDSTPPVVWGVTAGPSRIVTGRTSFKLSAKLSEASAWKVTISGAGGDVAAATGTTATAAMTWGGLSGGKPVPSGTYGWRIDATDQFGNTMSPESGSFLVWDGSGTRYQAVGPVRLLDSRVAVGLSGAFATGRPRTFQVAGRGGVPLNAVAVTGNLTVVGQTSAGYVGLTPVATSLPTTSVINAPRGDVRANGVTVALSADGTLSAVFRGTSGSSANLVFDVTGFFAPSSGATYVPVDPVRLLDSRSGNGLTGRFSSGTARTVKIAGRGGIPTGVVAVTGNVTVTHQTSAGWLAVTPTANNAPSTSTLNFPAGDNRANNFTVRVASDGSISAVFRGLPGASADVIIDITGYFVAGNAGATFVPIDPTRIVDTRFDSGLPGAFAAGTPRTFAVAGGGVPSTAIGITGNVTVVGPSAGGWVTVAPVVSSSTMTSTINFPSHDTRANGVDASLDGGDLSAVFRSAAGATVELIFDVTGYFTPAT